MFSFVAGAVSFALVCSFFKIRGPSNCEPGAVGVVESPLNP